MSQLEDGKIFLKDKRSISLIDHLSGETVWEMDFTTTNDPKFLDDLPIMYFEGKSYAVVDATSGYVIDESEEKTKILNIFYYWDLGRVVIEMEQDKSLHILNIDLNDLSNSWNSYIGPMKKSLFGPESQNSEYKPIITDDGSLVIVNKKYVAIVHNNGTVTSRIDFKKNLKPLEYNKEKKIFYVLENKRKLHFIDVTSGATNATFEFAKTSMKFNVLGDGSTISVVQKNELRILDGIQGMQVGSRGFKSKITQTYIDEESGAFFILSKKVLAEIDHNTGDIIREARFEKSFDALNKVYDKVILSGKSGAIPINMETLKLEYKILPDIPPVHDYVENDNFVIYTNQTGDNFTLSVVDFSGNVVWD